VRYLAASETLNIPIYQKLNLTLEEAMAYSNIGEHTLRGELAKPYCPFALKIGNRTLVKRKEFETWNSNQNKIK
jgi:hypothetical protein